MDWNSNKDTCWYSGHSRWHSRGETECGWRARNTWQEYSNSSTRSADWYRSQSDSSTVAKNAPSVQCFHRAMESALSARLEGITKLPEDVLVADRDRNGRWGEKGGYFAYCLRCQAWLPFDKALKHADCKGTHWCANLSDAAREWSRELNKMADRVHKKLDPYFGILDLREEPSDSSPISIPNLVPGRRQLIRVGSSHIQESLDVVIDLSAAVDVYDSTREDPSIGASTCSGLIAPLRVLLYFHGHGEDFRQAPENIGRSVVIAIRCPRSIGEHRCFWFQLGDGGAWERHEHEKLWKCEAMLFAVEEILRAILSAVRVLLIHDLALENKAWLMGVSMGGHAALEFAREFPDQVGGIAVVAGYYPEVQIEPLAATISSIPLLLVHRRGDRCCPFHLMQKLYDALGRSAGGGTAHRNQHHEAWFSSGDHHGPSDEELEAVINWIRESS